MECIFNFANALLEDKLLRALSLANSQNISELNDLNIKSLIENTCDSLKDIKWKISYLT